VTGAHPSRAYPHPVPQRILDVFSLLASVVLGAVVGAAGSFLQSATVLGLPIGLVVALLLSAAAVVGSGLATGGRLGAALALAAWLGTVILLSLPRPEGDLVLAAHWPSYAWLYGGTLGLGACLAPDYRRLAAGRSGPAG